MTDMAETDLKKEVFKERQHERDARVPPVVTYHTRLPNIMVKCRGTFIQYWSHLSDVVRLSSLFQSWAGVLKA